jgi:serine protease Do
MPITRYFLPFFLLAGVAGAQASPPEGAADHKLVDEAIAAVKPALVRIHVAVARFERGREEKSEAAGSGVIVSADGYVVTNHHVAGHAKRLLCTLADRTEVEADLVGSDPLCDIAVIRLRSDGQRKFPFARWGDSSKLRVGDTVLAMGSPLALSQSVTMGIVSNTEMVMPDILGSVSLTLEGEDVGTMVRWIGHDASISPGNSGGPLVNLAGEVVGINEIEMGLAGAIPSNVARPVAESIIASGSVKRASIGISVQPLLRSENADRGVLVNGVLPKSPADAAGIKAGDILTKLNGEDVFVKFAEQVPIFNEEVAGLPIGSPVDVEVLRDGQPLDLKITPIVRQPAEEEPIALNAWGLAVSDISGVEARERKLASTDGALVQSVGTAGPSGTAKPALAQDDIIREVDAKPVKSVADLRQITAQVVRGHSSPVSVLVGFQRDDENLVTVVQLGAKDLEDPGLEAKKAYLPVATQVLTPPIAKAMGLEGKKGFRITRVNPGSTAEKAGLKTGDVILAVDGQPLEAGQPEDAEMLAELIRQYDIGAKVELKVVRSGTVKNVPVTLEESPLSPREMKRYTDSAFEFTVRQLAQEDRSSLQLDKSVAGVLVESVGEGGWAALGKLQAEDVVLSVNGASITGLEQFRDIMNKIAEQKPKYVVFRVLRGIQQVFLELAADWSSKN